MLWDRAAFCPGTTAKSRPKGWMFPVRQRAKGRSPPFRPMARPDMYDASKPNLRSGGVHGSQDKVPGVVHRLGHAFQERLGRRSSVSVACELADYRRDPWT